MATYLDTRRRPMPFLQVSQNAIGYIDSHLEKNNNISTSNNGLNSESNTLNNNVLEFDNVMTFWTTLTKTSDVIQNGKRMENMSWRIVNRKLILKNDFSKSDFNVLVKVSKNSKCKELETFELKKTKGKYNSRQQSRTSSNNTNTNTNLNSSNSNSNVSNNMKNNNKQSLFVKKKNIIHNNHNINQSERQNSDQSVNQNTTQNITENTSLNTNQSTTHSTHQNLNYTQMQTVPSLFNRKSNIKHDVTNDTNQAPKHKRKTKFFFDHSSPESASPPNSSKTEVIHQSINKIIEEETTDNLSKNKITNKNKQNVDVSSLFNNKNDGLHSLFTQVQKNHHTKKTENEHSNKNTTEVNRHHYHSKPAIENPAIANKVNVPSLFGKSNAALNNMIKQNNQPMSLFNKKSDNSSKDSGKLESKTSNVATMNDTTTKHKNELLETKNNVKKSGSNKVENLGALRNNTHVSLFNNNKSQNNVVVFSSSDDELDEDSDDLDDDSDWSSLSEDEYEEEDHHQDYHNDGQNGRSNLTLNFEKKMVLNDEESGKEPILKRSLLSGLFLDKMNKQDNNDNHPIEKDNYKGEDKNEHSNNPLSPPLLSNNRSTSSISSLLANNRKPSGHYDKYHKSNAPPTASTILPTALSTHMFLPTKNFNNDLSYQMVQKRQNQNNNSNSNANISHLSALSSKKNGNKSADKGDSLFYNNAESNYNNSNIVKLTTDNIAKYTTTVSKVNINNNNNNHEGEEDIEYASSIRTSTSSIDIPGTQNKLLKERRRLERQREWERQKQQVDNKKNANGGFIVKELPVNLVDSIQNENKIFGRTIDKTCKNAADNTTIKVNNEFVTKDNCSSECPKKMKHPQIFSSDGFIDDSIVKNIIGGKIDDNQGDELDYHAKGW